MSCLVWQLITACIPDKPIAPSYKWRVISYGIYMWSVYQPGSNNPSITMVSLSDRSPIADNTPKASLKHKGNLLLGIQRLHESCKTSRRSLEWSLELSEQALNHGWNCKIKRKQRHNGWPNSGWSIQWIQIAQTKVLWGLNHISWSRGEFSGFWGVCCVILYFGHVASKRVFHALQSNVIAQKINRDFSIVQREGGGRRAKAHSLMSNPLCPDP